MSKKQITLFQTWNKNASVPNRSDVNLHTGNGRVSNSVQQFPTFNTPSSSNGSPFQSPKHPKEDELADPKFDYEAGKTWIYPTNYPVRDYQFSIVQEALFKNTLVVLPTGLGKTFIAAVVMFNIYRWFPNGKVLFLAPTKPLVAQQIDACLNITGIPEEDTTQMTGTNAAMVRKMMWMKKRVFFLTPQVLINDLVRNICPACSIKCVVVDEAHKALGNYSYCQVIQELCSHTSEFRVLALTATPGSEPQAVKQVISNLLISHVEVRSENSADVQQYTHTRNIEKIIVPLGDRLTALKSKFLDVINVYLKRLSARKVITPKNPALLSKYQVLKLREAISKNPPGNIDRTTFGLAMADLSLLISLYHAYELLLLHGATSFYNYLTGVLNGDKSIPHTRSELLKNFEFQQIMEKVKEIYIPEPCAQSTEVKTGQIKKKKVLPGHPKLDKLLEVILQHFRKAEFENSETRVMVFTQYRDSVQEIVDILNQYQPTIKAMSFKGQSSASASNVGYTQKQQLEVIQKFRSGGYNTLVSTCVGEEGLDIGEVDLIVCYDCPKSPIRSVQRMGRTGRLREGHIIMLVSEGKEEQMYNTCEYRKKSIYRSITRSLSFEQLHQSPSLIPPGIKPVCVKTVITIERKKVEAKVKVVSKSAFLNDEEMREFNQHVKVPQKATPLLPKREFIVLKKQEASTVESTSCPSKPQISFSEWTIWQTTPQQTDMIPHSSKSLLLVKTLENIHFPELLSSKKSLNPINTDFQNNNLSHSQASHFMSFSKQTKITELISGSKITEDDMTMIFPSPEKEIFERDVQMVLDESSKKLPLIERLFAMNLSYDNKREFAFDLKLPPISTKIFTTENFSLVDVKKIVDAEIKSVSIIHVLNKKMKAKLKRKSKELGKHVFSQNIQFTTPKKRPYCPTIDESGSSTNLPLLDVHAKSVSEDLKSSQSDAEAVLFDIDFDVLDTFENDEQICSPKMTESNALPCPFNENSRTLQSNENHLNFDADFHKRELSLISKPVERPNSSAASFITNDKKKYLDLETSKDANNGKDYSDMVPVSSAVSTIFNKNKEILGINEKKFDSVNDDKDFHNVKKSNSNHNDETNLSNISFRVIDKEKNQELEIPKKINDERNCHYIISPFKLEKDSIDFMDNSKNFSNISSSMTEENQHSVLKDMKNICHVSVKERRVKNVSHANNTQAMNNVKNIQSEIPKDCNSVTKSKNIALESFQFRENEDKLQNADVFDNFEKDEVTETISSKNCFPTKGQNDANNFNISSTDCKEGKLLLRDKNDIQILDRSNKNVSKNIAEYSTESTLTNKSICPDLENKTGKMKDSNIEEHESHYADCNFDISFDNIDVDVDFNSSTHGQDILSESSKISTVPRNVNSNDHLNEFDESSASILDQLFTSQKNVSADPNSSFSSPLTVKRCISEDSTSKRRKKLQRLSVSFHNHPSTSHTKSEIGKQTDSKMFNVPVKNELNLSKFNGNQSLNLVGDTSQCTLTQLLSLIDGTEQTQRYNLHETLNSPSNNEDYKIIDASSEDEICPTPEKKVVKLKSEFIYNKNSSVTKSLDFKNYNKTSTDCINLQKGTENAQKKIQPTIFKFNNHALDKFEPQEKVKENINLDDQSSKTEQKCSTFHNAKDSVEFENKTAECELSPKISFDISFDLPSTQNDVESSQKDEVFDMNNALIIESSSSEENMYDDYFLKSEAIDKKINLQDKISLNNISKKSIPHTKNSHIEEICLSDDSEPEDSESLLSSKPTRHGKSSEILIKNISDDFIALNNQDKHSIFKSNESVHEESLKENNVYEVKGGGKQCCFENSILSHHLHPKDSIISNCIIESEKKKFHFKHKNNNSVHFEADKKNKKISETNLNPSNNADIHVQINSSENNSKCVSSEKCVKNLKNLSEKNLNSNVLNLENDVPVVNSECLKFSEEFSEEKLCFDINSVDDKAFDCLLSFNSTDFSEEHKILQNKSSNQNIRESSVTSKGYISSDQLTRTKENEDLKNISKKSILEKIKMDNNEKVCSNVNVGKLNERNDELVWEFDLGDENQSLLLELGTNNHQQPVDNNKEQTSGNNSSDEFVLSNPKQPSELCSKHTLEKQPKISNGESSICKVDDVNSKQIKQPYVSNKKFSSKLSIKNKTVDKTILKDKKVIEDEDEDDFQFVRKVLRKPDKPPDIPGRKKKKAPKKNNFFLSQVEVSGSDNSGNESDDDDDLLEESFIDDESTTKLDCTDQHAFYLKSLKSYGLPQRFKLKAVENKSILPENELECSEYQLDSFCVNDDVIILSSDDDIEMINSPLNYENKNKISKKSKNKRRAVIHDSTTSSEYETSPKVRKFNKKFSSTANASDDHSIITVRKPKHKLVITSSDEDEHSFLKPVDPKSYKNSKSGKGKNGKKRLQRIVEQDSTTSSEHEISPKVKKRDEKTSCPDNDITTLKTKHKVGIISSDEENEDAFKRVNSELHKRVGNAKLFSNNLNGGLTNLALDSESTGKSDVCANDNYSVLNKDVRGTTSVKSSHLFHSKPINNPESQAFILNNLASTSSSKHWDLKKCDQVQDIPEVVDISFDIGWDEVFPTVSKDDEASPLLSSKEDTLACKSINVDYSGSTSTILIDSRELASGKPIISALRNIHKINSVVMPLSSADYIISNRIAIERILDSEFNSVSMPPKISDKVKEIIDLYEKPVVIIEKDNRKGVISFNRNVTKYLQFIVHLNCHTCIKVLLSKSTDHTAELIANLVQQEKRSGFHINVPVALNQKSQKLFDFYCSFPNINPVCALNFMYHFPTVQSLLKSSLEELKKKGCISSHKANGIHKYFRSELTFHENM